MYIPIGFDSNLQLEYGESMKITEDNWLEILRDKYGGWGKQSEFSAKSGVAQSVLNKIINGRSKNPGYTIVQKIIDALTMEAENMKPEVSEKNTTINVYSVAGAGPGFLPAQLDPLFQITTTPEYLRRSDYAVLVDGHSMEPMIPHGSVVGIKCDVPFKANEIFLADIPYEGLVVKRVGVDLKNNEFIFKSENPDKEAYPDFRLSIAEAEKIIIGRVVWITIGY
jgi:phage repressor protein C with HTH and peptisase S24 domain